MELKMENKDWFFLFLCILVGIVAEEAFFRYQIGISFFVFIITFYSLFYWRFRSSTFSHQRIGYLLLISIWSLAAGFYVYDTIPFYVLNILVIPGLVVFHIVLITSPKNLEWSSLNFIFQIIRRLVDGIRYNFAFIKYTSNLSKDSDNKKKFDVWKKIVIGIVISIPFLFIIINLLISADTQFARILNTIPNLLTIKVEYVSRFAIIVILTFLFFGFMQALSQRKMEIVQKNGLVKSISMDGIITLTFLILLDLVYILFVAVQFKYFFSGTLETGFTYAEYARRGFFELLFVTIINLTVTVAVIYSTNHIQGFLNQVIRLTLSVLVLSSSVILISAFMRMLMYEDAYGFTFLRVLVHSFMIFLMLILAYTLVKIWIDQLSLFHFYFIAALIYYGGINTINLDWIVVKQNIARYEETGKIDIHYLNQFSSTGVIGLIELYEKNPNVPGLKEVLVQRKQDRDLLKNDGWQSHNYTRNKAYKKLSELEL